MPDIIHLHYPLDTFALITLAFLVAGTIKGILGMGLPVILMVSLTLMMPPLEAIALIFFPMMMMNVWQFLRGPHPKKTASDFRILAIFAFVVIILVGLNLRRFPEEMLLSFIGMAMILFAIPNLYGWRLRLGPSQKLQAICGVLTGVLGGISSIWSPPVVMYLVGRGLQKDEFVGAVGFIFMVASIGIGIALGTIQLLGSQIVIPSLTGLGISLIGFRIGEHIRKRIDAEFFTKIVMIAFLFTGCRLVFIALVS